MWIRSAYRTYQRERCDFRYPRTSKMLERPSAHDVIYRHHHHHHSNRPAMPRHSALHRQKSRNNLMRQHTSYALTPHVRDRNVNQNINLNDANNNNNAEGNIFNNNNNQGSGSTVSNTGNYNTVDLDLSVTTPVARPQHKQKLLVRQYTAFSLPVQRYPHNNNDSTNDNNNDNGGRRDVSNRVKHFVLKLSQTGFIKSFLNLDYSYEVDKGLDTHSASDELVGDLNQNIAFEPDITAKIINKDEFELGQVLGAGGFGRVYKGTFKGEQVAIKVMHKFTKNPDAQLQSFMAELHVMRFHHPYIVKTLAATHIDQFDDGAWIVMEYVSQKCLLSVINDFDETIDAERRLKYAIQMSSALQYAHKRKVAHLDLKPPNILIKEDGNCKVGDFGCSQRVEFDTGVVSPTNRSILTGTFAYRAPELLRGQPPTFKADIYSYGVTLWQLLSRETPYSNQNQHVVIFGVCANGLRPRDPDPTETDPFELSYKSLYAQCWHTCPLDRPSAQELVELLSLWKDNLRMCSEHMAT